MAETTSTTDETGSWKNRRALLGGAVGFTSLMLVVAGCGYNTKPKSSAVNPETKAKLAATIEPTAANIAKQVLEFKKLNPTLVDVQPDKYNPSKNRELVYIQSFGSYDMFNVYVGMLRQKGRLDSSTVYEIDVFRNRRGNNDDYGTPHNASQEVDIYKGADEDGSELWGVTDYFTPPGYNWPTIYIGTRIADPSASPSSPEVLSALESARVWSGVEQATIDEALSNNNQYTIKPHF